ncbi:MAG: hypothetical protein ACI4KF_09270 [Huintestinicola sp.]
MFGRKKTDPVPVPEECRGLEVRVESSICTGEKTIGFYDKSRKRLLHSELVRSEEDIRSFCNKYGVEVTHSNNQ